jgi:methyltransferase
VNLLNLLNPLNPLNLEMSQELSSALLLALAFLPMLFEARRSAANERRLLSTGAREPADDVYGAMRIAYPACFVAMVLESWVSGRAFGVTALAGSVVFVGAKALKYWAIATLGDRWTFRVLVPPGSSRTLGGPYRVLRHPNYIGVAGELLGFALLAGAPIAGALACASFGALLIARIRVEERALGLRSR